MQHFWPISKKKTFPKYGICAGTQHIIQIFIVAHILWKLMTKFFFKIKKHYFFWEKRFSKTYGSATHNFMQVSSTMPTFKKKRMNQFQKKHPDRQKNRQKDRRTDRIYFKGHFQLPLQVQQVQLQQTSI